jgi:hypothetical protein
MPQQEMAGENRFLVELDLNALHGRLPAAVARRRERTSKQITARSSDPGSASKLRPDLDIEQDTLLTNELV